MNVEIDICIHPPTPGDIYTDDKAFYILVIIRGKNEDSFVCFNLKDGEAYSDPEIAPGLATLGLKWSGSSQVSIKYES